MAARNTSPRAAGDEEARTALTSCRQCPRLVAYREEVARTKVARHRDDVYWGRPVPGWGDPRAGLLVLGLAPGAHGGNRTGRAFTGDGAGAFLLQALTRVGLVTADADGAARPSGVWLTNAVKCAPPANRPTAGERDRCAAWLAQDLACVPARAVVALGAFAWDAALRCLELPGSRPRFAHGARLQVDGRVVLATYHPSRQNTNTGRLTPAMLDGVLREAIAASERTDAWWQMVDTARRPLQG